MAIARMLRDWSADGATEPPHGWIERSAEAIFRRRKAVRVARLVHDFEPEGLPRGVSLEPGSMTLATTYRIGPDGDLVAQPDPDRERAWDLPWLIEDPLTVEEPLRVRSWADLFGPRQKTRPRKPSVSDDDLVAFLLLVEEELAAGGGARKRAAARLDWTDGQMRGRWKVAKDRCLINRTRQGREGFEWTDRGAELAADRRRAIARSSRAARSTG